MVLRGFLNIKPYEATDDLSRALTGNSHTYSAWLGIAPSARGNISRHRPYSLSRGDRVTSIDLGGTLKALKGERARVHQDLAKLDKAITVLEGLSGTSATLPKGHGRKGTMSAAARRKIGKAQKLRWARLKQQAGKK